MKKFLGISKKSAAKLSKQEKLDQKLLNVITKDPCVSTISALIKKGANVNMEICGGNRPLHIIAGADKLEINKSEIADLLIKNKADINVQNNSGDTPVCTALKWANNRTIMSFLDYDVNLKIENEYGNTLLNIAASKNDLEVIDKLIRKGSEINHINKKGISPLHTTLTGCRWDVAQFLIENGADVNAKSLYDNNTPLHIIIEYGDLGIMKSLIDYGVDINAQNKHGDTALHIKIKTLNSFLHNNSKVSYQDFANFLDFLNLFDNTEINLNIKNQNGQRVLKFLCLEYQKLKDFSARQSSAELVNYNLLSQFKEKIIFFAKKAQQLGEDITEYENLIPGLFLEIVAEKGTKSASKVVLTHNVSSDSGQAEIANLGVQFIDQNFNFHVETLTNHDNVTDRLEIGGSGVTESSDL